MSRDSHDRLQGCHVLSLRPVGAHASLRRAVAAEGGKVIALSPWKLLARQDATTRERLAAAMQADCVLFTSPMAVHAAAALQSLSPLPGQHWLAVGSRTAQALELEGVASAASPERMDSEGLLALPALQSVQAKTIGLVTAPGGRGEIEATLLRRGARILRADVYQRTRATPSSRGLATLASLTRRPWLALSSAGALEGTLSVLAGEPRRAFLQARVAAASERLGHIAANVGFDDIVIADSALPEDLVAAMVKQR